MPDEADDLDVAGDEDEDDDFPADDAAESPVALPALLAFLSGLSDLPDLLPLSSELPVAKLRLSPVLKSVSYQPPPDRRNPEAETRFFKLSLPQCGQALGAGSDIFCRISHPFPQDWQMYSYIGMDTRCYSSANNYYDSWTVAYGMFTQPPRNRSR